MQVIPSPDSKSYQNMASQLNHAIFYPLLKVIFTMLITGTVAATIIRLFFFWAPRKIRNYLIQIAAGLGVIFGLYLAFVVFKF